MLLNAHSWFSLKYGVLSPEDLLKELAALGLSRVALTDINCSAGHSEFFRQAKDHGIQPVAGIDLRVGMRQLYVGLARNTNGLHQLNGLLTDQLLDGEALPERAPELPDSFLIYPFGASHVPEELRENEFIGVRPGDINRLRFARHPHPREKLVALTAATFRHKTDLNTHRLLRAIHNNTLHTKLTPQDLAPPDERLLSPAELQQAYAGMPDLLHRTQALLEQCEVDLGFDVSKNRRLWGATAEEDRRLLHELAHAGLHHRYARITPVGAERLEKELRIIEQKDFVSYFLINWDLVRFAKAQGFFHVGRGSGANSLVAYCLGITDVDPIELDLYFERFINPARSKPPDFDIDFSWKDRDHVTRRLFQRYGEGRRVALLATYSTFQQRAIVNELGKVFGLPPHEIAALSDGDPATPRWIGKGDRLQFGGRIDMPVATDPIVRAIHRYTPRLLNMPGHFSIHVGGVLISEEPLTHYTALHLPPKGFPTTQISMVEAEDLGLYKFDILSQRGLGHIRDAVELVNEEQGRKNEEHGMKNEERRSADEREEHIQHGTWNEQCASLRGKVDHRGNEEQGKKNEEHGRRNEERRSADEREEHIQHGTWNEQCASLRGKVDHGGNEEHGMKNEERRSAPTSSCHVDPSSFSAAVDIHDIARFKEDPRIKEMLRTGDTIGCFYVESPAMRMLMKKMQVQDYKGLVAASSIIRPGVAHSGMMREYLLRYHDPERRKLAPPKLLEIMPETFGVMVYQEDVIKVGYEYAGLSLEEADILRRSMSGKFRNRKEFSEVRESFFKGALAKGHALEEIRELWGQIVSFGDFSFAKGHSASYAVESYQSLFLKAHHPLQFLVGVANNFGGFYHTEFYLHEAKRVGAVIEAPCINTSEELCSLRPGATRHSPTAPRIYLGLGNVRGLAEEVVQLILAERRRHGPFAHLPDLLHRVPLHMEQARTLVRVGALRFTGRSKPHLLWDLALLHHGRSDASANGDLFVTKVEEATLPELEHYPLADAYDELDLLGFPLCDPFSLVFDSEQSLHTGPARESEQRSPAPPGPPRIVSKEMSTHIGQRVEMLGYMIHVKATHTHGGQDMTFGSFIDTAGDLWDSTQFPYVAQRFPFRGRGIYRLTGVIEEEFGHCALRTQYMEKLPWKPDPRYGDK